MRNTLSLAGESVTHLGASWKQATRRGEMEAVDSLELSVRLSRLRLSLRIKKPSLYPDYENEQTLGSRAPSTIQVRSDTDSGFASPALLSSPPHSPSPTTPADGEYKTMESTAETDDCLSAVCSSAAEPGRRVPLFSVTSQDCSSTCSIVSLNIPNPQKPSQPTPPLPPRVDKKSSSLPPPLPPKPQSNRHLPGKPL